MTKEIWKPVVGFPDYEISSYGRVRSHKLGYLHMMTLHLNPAGYLRASLTKDLYVIKKLVHKLVLEAFVGPCPPGYETNHKDTIKSNNGLKNLEWVTRGENAIHAYRLGTRSQIGERNAHAKLKKEEVRIIRDLAEKVVRKRAAAYSRIAATYGVSFSTIYDIVAYRSWTHI